MAEEAVQMLRTSAGSVPVPDPTALTTQQLFRELSTLREFLESKINGVMSTIKMRLSGMSDRLPAQVDAKLFSLQVLHQEKFDCINLQFKERDVRTEQTAVGVKIAVDAALQAAKEAVGEQNRSFALATAKSEAATTKQIDAQGDRDQCHR